MKDEWKVREIFLEGLFDSSEMSSKKETLDRLGLLRMPSFSSSQEGNSGYASDHDPQEP